MKVIHWLASDVSLLIMPLFNSEMTSVDPGSKKTQASFPYEGKLAGSLLPKIFPVQGLVLTSLISPRRIIWDLSDVPRVHRYRISINLFLKFYFRWLWISSLLGASLFNNE